MKYEILNDAGKVERTILAELEFVEKHFPGRYREYIEPVSDVESNKPRRVSKLDFIMLFTDSEYVAILQASKASVQVEAWYKKFEMTTPNLDGTAIDLDDERTISGVQSLEAAGLIAEGRATEILGKSK